MPLIPVDTIDDPRLAVYRSLKSTNQTRGLKHFVVEGEKLVSILLESRFPVVSVLTTDRHVKRLRSLVSEEAPLLVIAEREIHRLVGYNFHQGALACGSRQPSPWPDLNSMLVQCPQRSTWVGCPRIDNPENLGAIIRIADVFGIEGVLIGPRAPDVLSRRVLRVSMGTALRLPVLSVPDFSSTLGRMRDEFRFEVAAAVATPENARPLDHYERADRLMLLLGSEAHGLDAQWLPLCDDLLTIPMRQGAESLNVAVAAGVLLYHLTRRATAQR